MSLIVEDTVMFFRGFFHKHYAWAPEDLTEKLSLEIWVNVSAVSGKITVFEMNVHNANSNIFLAVQVSRKSNL